MKHTLRRESPGEERVAPTRRGRQAPSRRTDASVDEIRLRAGCEDVAFFRRRTTAFRDHPKAWKGTRRRGRLRSPVALAALDQKKRADEEPHSKRLEALAIAVRPVAREG